MVAWVLVIILVVAAVIVKLKRSNHFLLIKMHGFNSRKETSLQSKTADGEAMVCCEHCGIYIPDSEAIRRGRKVFCSKEHSLKAFF